MSRGFLIILLGTWCAVSSSQPVLTQESSMSASPGETVKLSCSMSSGYPVQNYEQVWMHQKPGSPPRYLVNYYTSPGPGTGEFSRFSTSKENSRNIWYLTISNVQAEDEAVYYCVVYSGVAVLVFGGGTTLIVIDPNHPTSPPNVHLFPPSSEEKESKNKATLVCLVDSFTPPDITIAWEADGAAVSNGVETTKPTKLNDKYVASSYLTLTPTDWEGHQSVSCKVTHKGTDYVKSVSHSKCP